MVPTPLIALTAGMLAAAGVGAIIKAFTPVPESRPEHRAVIDPRQLPIVIGSVIAGFIVLVATGWFVVAVAVSALVLGWRWLFVIDEASNDRAKVQAIAKWLEDLRDVTRRSSVSPEEALELVAEGSSGALNGPLSRFVLRRRQGVPLPDALTELADAIAHPTADAAVAAIMLVIAGGAGGARLYDTVDELAEAARDEAQRRDEIDRLRRVYQRAMRRLLAIVIAFICALYFFASSLIEPYREPIGQLWLIIPVSTWALCLISMRRLTRYDLGTRYRLRIPTRTYQ
jgi:tight adherence protein B